MKIYFAGAIRGGRDDADLYLQIIEHLKKYGEVLTEHVGNDKKIDEIENDNSDGFIHNRDMKWLSESDVIVAEVTQISLGVGYEIGRAIGFNKKILCLSRPKKDQQVSAMITGSPELTYKVYSDLSEAKKIIDGFFE